MALYLGLYSIAIDEITFGEDPGMLWNQRSVGNMLHLRTAPTLLARLNDTTWITHARFRMTV
jgi:hypothetical protein